MFFRSATLSDCPAILDLYSYYVLHTPITFEYDVPSLGEIENRVKSVQAKYPYLVAEVDGVLAGYAYAADMRTRTAYQWSPECAIYLHKDFRGRGIGKLLYGKLFSILKAQGFVNVFACITMPNPMSHALHLGFGFKEIGINHNVGYKLGEWHSIEWLQLQLNEYVKEPAVPKPVGEIDLSAFLR